MAAQAKKRIEVVCAELVRRCRLLGLDPLVTLLANDVAGAGSEDGRHFCFEREWQAAEDLRRERGTAVR